MRVRYGTKKQNKKIRRLILLIVIVIIVILLALLLPWKKIINKQEDASDKVYISLSDYSTAKEVLERFGNTLISEENHKDDEYPIVIKAKMCKNLFTDGQSNEIFYNTIITRLAYVEKYKCFQLIDEANSIEIKVKCENSQIKGLLINGQSNYFNNTETNIALQNRKDEIITNLTIESPILLNLISNNWETYGMSFGTKDSRYEQYDIYFDEGIKVRVIAGKIYNIVFTQNYQYDIVNQININSNKEQIKETLGEPTFDDEYNCFGYKSNDIYIFFSEGEISVYRVENSYDTDELVELISEFNSTNDAKKLGNDLTYLWNDYNVYDYDTNYVKLEYALKGFRMQFNVGKPNGFVFYNNYTGKVNENDYIYGVESKRQMLRNTYYIDEDLVFRAEIDRVVNESLKYNFECDIDCEEEIKPFVCKYTENNSGFSNIKFISSNKEYADSQLDENLSINYYIWLDDYNFIYSISNKGIYLYNCIDRTTSEIIKGNDIFELKGISENKLKYDNKSIDLSR